MLSLLPLLQIVGLSWVLILPGILVIWPIRAAWSPGVRALVGASLGMLAMPMLCFCVACLLHSSITPALSLTVATIVNASAAGVLLLRRRAAAPAPSEAPPSAPSGPDA